MLLPYRRTCRKREKKEALVRNVQKSMAKSGHDGI